jgi:hypothetical protein
MIGNSQDVCSGSVPAQLVNIVLPTGYTGTIEYKWQLSTTGSGSGFMDIAGSNAAFYAPGALTVNTWFKRLARVNCMSGWADAVESNVIAITVEPRPGGVMIKHN